MGTKPPGRVNLIYGMIRGRTTLSEMSKALNLSVSTVSKSLSDSQDIGVLTKKRVKEFAKKCHYKPNSFASGLRNGHTKIIGLIIPNILNPFYANALVGIEKHLNIQGYKLITSISHESSLKESKCMEMMASGYVDGLIMCLSKETQIKGKYDHFIRFKDQGLPLVLFDRINDNITCDKVIIDDFQASFDATEYLIKKRKCRKIALVSLINDFPHGKLRADGYDSALRINGMDLEEDYIVESNNVKDFKEKIKGLLKHKKVDGIFGVHETATNITIHISRSLGYDISKDLSIAAFCNPSQMAYNPTLTIVDQHAEKIGRETAKIILDRIRKTNLKEYKTSIIRASLSE